MKNQFTRFYSTNNVTNASRLDRTYTRGTVSSRSCTTVALPFSDHLGVINELNLGGNVIPKIPRVKPLFKSSPWVIQDPNFKAKLKDQLPIWLQSLTGDTNILDWWDNVFKRRLKSLMIEHSSIMTRQRRGVINLLNLQLSHATTNLMSDRSSIVYAEYESIKLKINNWYQEESKNLLLRCKARDIDESESATIYHHQMHQKRFKRSSLLKLDTPEGMKIGHTECQKYMGEFDA